MKQEELTAIVTVIKEEFGTFSNTDRGLLLGLSLKRVARLLGTRLKSIDPDFDKDIFMERCGFGE